MTVNISDDILRLQRMGLLSSLLKDKATRRNILWASDAYRHLGGGYRAYQEMNETLITGRHADIIKTRARKAMEHQAERTKKHAEVFTPLWVVREMVDYADSEYFGKSQIFFNQHGRRVEQKIPFAKADDWQKYVDARRLEITCGEAPFLTTRYDVETGEYLPCAERVGVFDRKMRVVSELCKTKESWIIWAIRALEASYGYELQGDNLLIARINLLMSVADYYAEQFKQELWQQPAKVVGKMIRAITWNLWQMDGLKGKTPDTANSKQLRLFPPFIAEGVVRFCAIRNHRAQRTVYFDHIDEVKKKMKFDFIIGNPPYQEEVKNNLRMQPIYNDFMDETYKLASKVCLIHPARFLFEQGQTPKEWNQKILNDPHFKVLEFELNSKKIFKDQDIRGGYV